MSRADYPDAVTHRIERLAAASSDEPEDERSAVAVLVGALRAEIGALRAELGSLRSETGDLGGRVAALSTRLGDSRVALESRLAVLEDTLDGAGERIEALSRDGASTTTDKLVLLEVGVAALGRTLEATLLERLSGVLQVRDEELRGQVAAALETTREQAAHDRAVMTELASSVQLALEGFSSVLAQSREERDVATELDTLTARVDELAVAGTATHEGLRTLSSSTDALAQVVEGFRTEWPTRTHEVAPAEPGAPVAQEGPATPAAPVRAGDVSTSRVALPKVAAARGASGTSVSVRPTRPGRAPEAASPRPAPEGETGEARPSYSQDRRARVDVMPQVRSPAIALEAAAPTPVLEDPVGEIEGEADRGPLRRQP